MFNAIRFSTVTRLILVLLLVAVASLSVSKAETSLFNSETEIKGDPVQIIRIAFRRAALLAKIDENREAYKAELHKLHEQFKSSYHVRAEADPMGLFWSEINQSLIPSVDQANNQGAARSFLRLSKLYDQCCRLPTVESGTAKVPAGKDFSSVELNAASPEVLKPETKPSDPVKSEATPTSVGRSIFLIAIVVVCTVSILIALFYIYSRRRKPKTTPIALQTNGVAKPLYLQDEQAKAHSNLDTIMLALRQILFEFGEPTIQGNQLQFGAHVINGDVNIVDQIRDRFGCFATIFMKDVRVTTNIVLPDGSRAIGTKLDPGYRYDVLMKDKNAFAGEVELFGQKILALYEPVVVDGEVIAILFIGSRMPEATA